MRLLNETPRERSSVLPGVLAVLAAILLSRFILPAPAAAVTLNVARAEVFYKSACRAFGNPLQFVCPDLTAPAPMNVSTCGAASCGNISNNPRIEFEQDPGIFSTDDVPDPADGSPQCTVNDNGGGALDGVDSIPGSNELNVCNDAVFLCTAINYTNELTSALALDELKFEIFKFQDGSNPLDPGSTPPLRTFFVDNPGDGTMDLTTTAGATRTLPTKCVLFDGNVNIQGEEGKTNGTYGFRVQAKTQVQGQSGNITITSLRAYPSGATLNAQGVVTSQKPITVDVTNIHFVRSSPTVVGRITGITAQPYNLTYRLSKDARMNITIHNATVPPFPIVRTVVAGDFRGGEGIPNGTLLNGDGWDGRFDNGDFGPPGLYLATLQAFTTDQFGTDLSIAVTRQIALDVLQITDLRVLPLLSGSTDLAVLTYQLTEPATVYVDIYPPATQFCRADGLTLNDVNNADMDAGALTGALPPKDFGPNLGTCGANIVPLRRIVETKDSRTDVINFWDGRDSKGTVLPDGNYHFVIYAVLPSQNGFPFTGGGPTEKLIWTSVAKTGFIPITRGFVGITQVTPGTTVIGSSPAVAGLDPFSFRYTLSRDANVTMKIFDRTGIKLVKTLVQNELRPGKFPNTEKWMMPTGDDGFVVSSGTYLVQLQAADPLFPAKVSTTTALFPINLFRITDIVTTPLLNRASDVVFLNFQFSQTMEYAWNIYPPATLIRDSTSTWPPCLSLTPTNCLQVVNSSGVAASPVISFTGLRAGRRRFTEIWDGRDSDGLFIPDGDYVFTLVGQSSTTPRHFASDKIFGTITIARGRITFDSFAVRPDVPQLFFSSSTITLHPFSIEYSLSRQSSVTIQILTANIPATVVRNLVSGEVRDAGILIQDVWDGRNDVGDFPATGFYNVRVVAEDLSSTLSSGSTAQVTIAFDPLRIYDVAVAPLRDDSDFAAISYQVSEPMKVSIKIFRPGTVFDLSGNPSPPESASLVKRIIGIRPARTAIEELWDGTDLRQSRVVDGTYKFKIVASTSSDAIDDLTGDVLDSGSLSLDQPIDDIPVVRNASGDPRLTFRNFTYGFPNPAVGPTVKFIIYSPLQGKISMKIFNIVGDLVLDKEFGEWPADSYVNGVNNGFIWRKVNQHGRKVARGVYLVVIRHVETLGGRNVLQTVKKIIIP